MISTIERFIQSRKVAYLGSVDSEGYPNIKTMLFPRKVVGANTFYFSTNTSSLRVSQFEKSPKACIYFNDTENFRGVMLRGRVEVLHDKALKEELWREGDTLYYPLGVTDPDYCVIKLTALDESPRCWGL